MLAIDNKRCFLKLRKNADRKCLFCSNVSTLLSMIVAYITLLNESPLSRFTSFTGMEFILALAFV